MDLIVAHNNADFDAFGSLVAAKKLYPNSKLLLPGSQERSVREFLSLVKDKIHIEREKSCDLSGIKRLVIVDTRHKTRIGSAAGLLEDASVEIHIYDHHPRTPYDIKADKDIFQEVGATVSILVDILRTKRGAKITPLEATILLLAIYEETGSLTYRTTTRLDVDIVSFLLSRGASLSAVSSYLNRKLTEQELACLTALISATKIVTVNGVNVAVAVGTARGFIGELGAIVRKLQDVENFPVLFAFFKIGDKIRVMARSRLKEVNVNNILKHFGGGGHASAASAKVEKIGLAVFEKKLMDILRSNIKMKILAVDRMSSPVKVISSDKTIREAKKILAKLCIKGAPVMEGKKLIGMITSGDVRKAERRGYGHVSVKGYMSRNVITTKPDVPIHAIQKVLFEKRIGRLPVMKNNKPVGIITRTDVLKAVHREIFGKRPPLKKKQAHCNISHKMNKSLPKEIQNILRTVGRFANKEGQRAFVVGGFVRDILLGIKNFDIDIVTEGDAIALAGRLRDRYRADFVAYKKFGTATVIIEKFRIDLATARKESYAKPAALPTVEFSSLKNDLHRRDFTINAMAASINKGTFGQLIDFFGGERDLENGVIRVLHDGSLIDDPTRIFRAVRFEQRLRFSIDKYTENLIKHAVREGMFSKTQNQRIRDELLLMMEEESPIRTILRMKELHELRFIHKKILIRKSTKDTFINIGELFKRYAARELKDKRVNLKTVYLMALFTNLSAGELESVCERFVFPRAVREKLLSYRANERIAFTALSAKTLSPGRIFQALRALSLEEMLFIAAKTKSRLVLSRIEDFLKRYSRVKIRISGHDLKKLGLEPGPLYSKLLTKVLHGRLDGEIKTKNDEIKLVTELVRQGAK